MSTIGARKRKRKEDPPRITFSAPGRTFERLFKEQSLETLKDTVRKKLSLNSEALEFSQIRDGKDIDLEDEDDFDAFKSFAVSNGVARIRVKLLSVPSQSKLPSQPLTSTSSEETQLDPGTKDKSSHGQDTPVAGPMTLTQFLMAGVMPLPKNDAKVNSAFSANVPSQSNNIFEQQSAMPNAMARANVSRAKIPKQKGKQAPQESLDGRSFGSNKLYPAQLRQDDNEVNRVVDEFLKRLDRRLCEHLKGPPWKDVWQASEGIQPHYARFIKNLGIPQVLGRPALLLHCLGHDVVDPEILSELSDGWSKILINTSGSGKTRLLLELLVVKWGFYFITAVDFASLRLGSQDVYDAIFMQIPNHTNFTEKPRDVHRNNSPGLEPAYRRNHNIVARFVHQILTARIIVFEHFLTTFRTLWPDGNTDINKAKLHWLSLQLNPSGILGCDVFKDLAKILDDVSNDFIMMDSLKIHNRLYSAVSEFKLDSGVFLVLDEAQVAAEQLAGCFRSYRSPEEPHPVLSPIIKSWLTATYFPIIVSSTGLSLNMINETVTKTAVGKPATFLPFTTTGAFDDKARQEKYIRRYTPPGFLDSDSGKEFIQRAWNFARGRHRFTAALLTQLLRTSFQSPHRTLNAFVKTYCGYTPSDAEQFINAEPEIREDFGAIIPLDLTKTTSRVDVLCNVSRALYKWLVLRIRLPFEKEKDDLIELGFARFVNDPEKGYIDEPLVLLGAAQEFSNSPLSLEYEALSCLQSYEGRGEYFEEFVAYSFTCAFDGQRKLCEFFSFGEHVPDWAQQCAEVVALNVDNGVVVSNRFHLPQSLGSTASIGKRCETVDMTFEWFRNPSSVICFPDKYMGPNIVLFVHLDSGLILAIEVKCQWASKGTLDRQTWESAVSTLDLAQQYRRKSLGTRKTDTAMGTVLDLFNHLNPTTPLPNDTWFQDGLPVLRVIASFPAAPPEAQRRGSTLHATLNMDDCAEVTHATGLLKSVSFSLLNARRYTEGGSAVVPAKRQHT